MIKPVEIKRDEDGVYTVLYFEKIAGWVQKFQPRDRKKPMYKALSANLCVKSFNTVSSAKDWLIGEYY
jgi:hypothetical protein